LAQGFQPIGFYIFGSTLLLNGIGPVGSGLLYRPNSFGLLQSITPLKLPIEALAGWPYAPTSPTNPLGTSDIFFKIVWNLKLIIKK